MTTHVSGLMARQMPRRNQSAFGAVLISLLVVGMGCSGGEPETGPSQQSPTPTSNELSDLVAVSASALVAQESFHFELTDEGKATLVSPELVLVWARGDVRVPGAVRGFLGIGAVGAPAAPLETEIRVIEGHAYVTNPLSGTWNKADATALPVKLDRFEEKIRSLMTNVGSLEYVGARRTEAGDGKSVRGTIEASAFRVLFEGALEDETSLVSVEVVIADADHLPYWIEIVGPLLHSDDHTASRVLTLSRFGEPSEFGVPTGF
jgi:hypothetical protein